MSIQLGTVSAAMARHARLRFVESVVHWEGVVQRQRVCDAFGVAKNHVTRDLSYYQQQYPGALDYRPAQRAYVPGPKFRPRIASDSPAEYLGLLQARADAQTTALLPLIGGIDLQLASLPSPAHGIDKDMLRDLVRALRNGTGVGVKYLAMRDDRPSQRTVWPHALINSGLRWYVRCFDGESSEFRSLVLARIESSKGVDDAPPRQLGDDAGWNRTVIAHVVPHPQLNPHQQAVVAREYGMVRNGKGWLWSVSLRQCLVGFFARRYRLDIKGKSAPEANWIVLRNPAELKPYFLPDSRE